MVTHELKFLTYATRSLNMVDGLIVAEYLRGDKTLEKFKIYDKKDVGGGAEETKKDT